MKTGSDKLLWQGRVSELSAYILAGGKSERFVPSETNADDKLRAEVAGQPQIRSLINQLSYAGHEVFCVADAAERFQDLGIRAIVDPIPSIGPISGLLAAIRHRFDRRGAGPVLLVAGDQLIWRNTWSKQLATSASDAIAVTFCNNAASTFFHPLPGRYHTRMIEDVVAAIEAGHHSLQYLLAKQTACQQIKPLDSSLPTTWSFNTRQQLRALLQRAKLDGHAFPP